ncbi:low molecular weight phosphatase family protein [Mangrovimonas sp. DI 80]|uniref:arsenate-mycothiol transferase ArsC n=1 Tax=Mangrovimonas sp. DI 80 TaxID=1779330 RepID=UPI000975CE76|nr:protein-tyrosine-phosphatase [Mangrovimonas sp. DI 80]OMP30014.1 protein-tyrosine-phosphatase [Mangrovimonas sp. DI 80]
MSLFKSIEEFISTLDVNSISEERKEILQPLVDYIQQKIAHKNDIRINFICTHNSRRSHLSQVWAQTMAYHFGIKQVFCYSGGTEATALFPMAAQTLQNTGFEIARLSEGTNPVYSIKYAENAHPIIGFSKKMDDEFNPKSEFAAIMTCDSANEACPIVPGAEQRIPIMFKDPKAFDNTPQQAEKYSERSTQIATELFYVFSKIQTN